MKDPFNQGFRIISGEIKVVQIFQFEKKSKDGKFVIDKIVQNPIRYFPYYRTINQYGAPKLDPQYGEEILATYSTYKDMEQTIKIIDKLDTNCEIIKSNWHLENEFLPKVMELQALYPPIIEVLKEEL